MAEYAFPSGTVLLHTVHRDRVKSDPDTVHSFDIVRTRVRSILQGKRQH